MTSFLLLTFYFEAHESEHGVKISCSSTSPILSTGNFFIQQEVFKISSVKDLVGVMIYSGRLYCLVGPEEFELTILKSFHCWLFSCGDTMWQSKK
jgi:hypothetical protein